jgi:hypothetical protein
MTKVLDLQALPESVRAMAARIIEENSCISVLSIARAQLDSKDVQKAMEALKPESCVSVLSIAAV